VIDRASVIDRARLCVLVRTCLCVCVCAYMVCILECVRACVRVGHVAVGLRSFRLVSLRFHGLP